jgi:hypothetical protein
VVYENKASNLTLAALRRPLQTSSIPVRAK